MKRKQLSYSYIRRHLFPAAMISAVICFLASGCSTENVKTGTPGTLSAQRPAAQPEEIPKSYVYTLKAAVSLRSGPGTSRLCLEQLEQNQTLGVLAREGDWLRVQTAAGTKGYVHRDLVSDTWIKVHKKERRLYLIKQDSIVKTCRIGLCPDNPLGDKCRMGDGGTPEGRFFICSMDGDPSRLKYGPRSMLLSYPGREDARRGFKEGLIDYETYMGILQALKDGRAPRQNTRLGGQIRIHGSGGKFDWTKGCVGLDDWDVMDLYKKVCRGTRVEIYKSEQQDRELNSPAYLSRKILDGAKREAAGTARYAYHNSALIKTDYPEAGRIVSPPATADALLRVFRSAGIDLQALINEDLALYPWRYSACSKNRRSSRLQPCHINSYFYHHAQVVTSAAGTRYVNHVKPGDVVISGGTGHSAAGGERIAVLDDAGGGNAKPQLITLWQQDGAIRVSELSGSAAASIEYGFRMTHPFDYQ